jgi:glycosyltransferase involved in cell wall biosynthesis
MKLSLVIPCYNEAAGLPELLKRCDAVARAGAEVILVDNGSTDETPRLLEALLPSHPGCRSVRVERNRGYGFGIVTGLRAATGDVLGWTHADLQCDPADALPGYEFFKSNDADVLVKGRRYGRAAADVVFTVGMSVFESALLVTPLWDINAQPTMFRRRFFETWSDPPDDFSLDLYCYYRARRAGLAVKRFPVHFGVRRFGASHWNVNWKAKVKFIRRTVAFSVELWRRGAA